MKIQNKLDSFLEKLDSLQFSCDELENEVSVLRSKLSKISSTFVQLVTLKNSIDDEQARKILKVSRKVGT